MSANKWTDYIEPRLDEIEMWAMCGVPQEEIAARLDISYSKFRRQRDEHPELKAALAMTKGKADALVIKALRDSAIGESLKDERVYKYKRNKQTGETEERIVERRKTKIPPNPIAAKFWLEKRLPETFGPDAGQGGTEKGAVIIDER